MSLNRFDSFGGSDEPMVPYSSSLAASSSSSPLRESARVRKRERERNACQMKGKEVTRREWTWNSRVLEREE